MFEGSLTSPFYIDVKDTTKSSLAIPLEAYTLNDSKCGTVIYEFTTLPALSAGQTTISTSTITFNNINGGGFPLGKLTVTVNVRGSLAAATIYSVNFDIYFVDCLAEAFTITNDANKDTTIQLRFPTFSGTFNFVELLTFDTVEGKAACTVW